ncbi:MAG: DUF6134 family protein [Alphaproteobacteria bacterium]
MTGAAQRREWLWRLAAAALCAVVVAPAARAACTPPAEKLSYVVRWGGDPIGRDEVEFTTAGNQLTVRTRIDVEARLLFVPVLRLNHESEELWTDGRLTRFSGRTVDNGAKIEVKIEPEGEGYVLTRNGERTNLPGDFLPGSPWCRSILARTGARVLVDLVNGKHATAEITGPVDDSVAIKGERRAAQRYDMAGPLEREAWFDEQGRVVRARWPAKLGPKASIELD